MPQHPADDFDADSLSQCISRGKRVAPHVKCDRLVDADFCYFLQYPVAIGDVWYGQYEIRSGNFAFVLVDDAFGNAAQFDFERRADLLPFLDDS